MAEYIAWPGCKMTEVTMKVTPSFVLIGLSVKVSLKSGNF
jgi:hypothetical protein